MAKNSYIGVYRASNDVNKAGVSNKKAGHSNKDVWRESLIINRGCRFTSEYKKVDPHPQIKEFFFAKCVKKVAI